MSPNNPATRECKMGGGGLHYWYCIDPKTLPAKCESCGLKLSLEHTKEVFYNAIEGKY